MPVEDTILRRGLGELACSILYLLLHQHLSFLHNVFLGGCCCLFFRRNLYFPCLLFKLFAYMYLRTRKAVTMNCEVVLEQLLSYFNLESVDL